MVVDDNGTLHTQSLLSPLLPSADSRGRSPTPQPRMQAPSPTPLSTDPSLRRSEDDDAFLTAGAKANHSESNTEQTKTLNVQSVPSTSSSSSLHVDAKDLVVPQSHPNVSTSRVSPASVTIVKPPIITRSPAAATAETYQMDQAAYGQYAGQYATPYEHQAYYQYHHPMDPQQYAQYAHLQQQHAGQTYGIPYDPYQAAQYHYSAPQHDLTHQPPYPHPGISAYHPTVPAAAATTTVTAAAAAETAPVSAPASRAEGEAQPTPAPKATAQVSNSEEDEAEDEEPVIEPLDDVEPEPVWRGSLVGIGAPCPVEAFYLAGTTAYPLYVLLLPLVCVLCER
jgi:hypothetical protein